MPIGTSDGKTYKDEVAYQMGDAAQWPQSDNVINRDPNHSDSLVNPELYEELQKDKQYADLMHEKDRQLLNWITTRFDKDGNTRPAQHPEVAAAAKSLWETADKIRALTPFDRSSPILKNSNLAKDAGVNNIP